MVKMTDRSSKELPRDGVLHALNIAVDILAISILYRLLLNTLGLESIGLWSVTLVSCSLVRMSGMGFGPQAETCIIRHAALQERQQIAVVIETALLSVVGMVLLVSLLMFPVLKMILQLLLGFGYNYDEAVMLLPYVLFSMWLHLTAEVLQSALNGLNRQDLREYTSIAGTLLFLVCAGVLVRRYGLVGLALSQIVQALFLLASSWMWLRRQYVTISVIPLNWSRSILFAWLAGAAFYQITARGELIMESICKALIAIFGGLTSAAYFEMASQLIRNLRALIVSVKRSRRSPCR